MKQLHYTGKSYWEDRKLYTKVTADFGYLLLYEGYDKEFETLEIKSKGYEEQMYTLNKLTAVRDWRQGGNTEVFLMNEKKLNNWLKKHKYDKIES